MIIVANGLTILLTILSGLVVACNYGSLIANWRRKRRGVTGRISMIFIVAQVCLLMAVGLSLLVTTSVLSNWLILIVGVSDPSLWSLVAFPFMDRRHR